VAIQAGAELRRNRPGCVSQASADSIQSRLARPFARRYVAFPRRR
jgi:hypothetical protein